MYIHTIARPVLARLGRLLALAALTVSLVAAVNATAASAATSALSAEKSDNLMGSIHTVAKTYKTYDEDDNVINRLSVSTDMHNYYLFVAFRARVTVRFIDANGQRIGDVNGDGQSDGEFSYNVQACGYLDPTCGTHGHDAQWQADERVRAKVMNLADRIEIEHTQLP